MRDCFHLIGFHFMTMSCIFKVLPVELSTLLETANEMEIFFGDADSHFFQN